MSVYVDNAGILYKGKYRHHMTADSLDELHAFAESLGIKRCWFHKARTPPLRRDRQAAGGSPSGRSRSG